MFNLYFFCKDDFGMAFAIAEHTARHSEYVRENSFDTLEQAYDRLDNIGSRWVFYPNACVTRSDRNTEVLVSVHMADGFNLQLAA